VQRTGRTQKRSADVRKPLRTFQRYRHAKLILKLAIRKVFWPHREDWPMRPRNWKEKCTHCQFRSHRWYYLRYYILSSPFPIRCDAHGDIESTSKLRQADFKLVHISIINSQIHHREISSISERKYVRIEHVDMQVSSISFLRESNSVAPLTKQ